MLRRGNALTWLSIANDEVVKRPRITAAPSHRPRGPEPVKLTDWIQAGAAILAAITGTSAVVVALDTLRDQQKITASQLELNRRVQDREDQRYAARVAWWSNVLSSELSIQNRSPVPLRQVEFAWDLAYDDKPPIDKRLGIANIPPCQVAVVRFEDLDPTLGPAADRPVYQSLAFAPRGVTFTDPNGRWTRGRSGLIRKQPLPKAIDVELFTLKLTPTPDCGEGD